MTAGTNWECPYCARAQTVTDVRHTLQTDVLKVVPGKEGPLGFGVEAVVCANSECAETTVLFHVFEPEESSYGRFVRPEAVPLWTRRIKPESLGKPQPGYIPAALREDYTEACLIRDLSPKAAATLARRCLQGMIRDFCGIKGKTLYAEITALKKAVDDGTAHRDVSADSVDAIDNVRKVGNIGAHMEADVEHIIPVDPDEAQLLIELVESLFAEWYVVRHKRQERFAALAKVADAKDALKVAAKLSPASGT